MQRAAMANGSAILGVRADGAAWRDPSTPVGWVGRTCGPEGGFGPGRGTFCRQASPGAWPAASARRAETGEGEGEERERAEREKKTTLLIGFFFSNFSIDTRKVLNTKVIPNFEPYHFCFSLIFIWGSVQKLNLKSRRTYVISRFEFELKFS